MNSDNRIMILSVLTMGLTGLVALVILYGENGDADRIMQFVATVVPTVLGYAFLHSKVSSVHDTAEETKETINVIEGHVNGKLDARLAELSEAIAEVKDTVGKP